MNTEVHRKRPIGRKMTPERLKYITLSQSVIMGSVQRFELSTLAKSLPCTGIINGTEAHLLLTLINTTGKEAFESGGMPIVFKSNRQLAFEINRSESRVSFLLSRLFDRGLISMQDSGNYKRYGYMSVDRKDDACGIDLRILVARYDELRDLVHRARLEQSDRVSAFRRYRGALRAAQAALAETASLSARNRGLFVTRIGKIAELVRKGASGPVLRRAGEILNRIAARIISTNVPSTGEVYEDKTICLQRENEMHIHITKPHLLVPCKDELHSANAEQIRALDAGSASEGAFEGSLSELPRQSNGQQQLRPSLVALADVWRATPSLAEYGYQPPTSWADLKLIAPKLCRIAGVSEDARQRAVERMGEQAAAVAIALTFEKFTRAEISSPGGYLRAMTDRAMNGALHLNRSVFGLAARNAMGRST
ncbi:plasmid replication protein RepC [Rhizobium sp. SL86]|uniref:plasmid replication protein RepC n=1 Tax=Rhizobium sp. SL86 TaxID=2995148 RepID=UPI00227296A7|nr:plasmid replication protein RepC [Rhizobium sp. SL86]MCY1667392.1 plasmid replication protein RepC [Rhizobium sp. SL86]